MTTRSRYRCRKVIIAFGLLHYPRKLAVLDALDSRKVYYKVPKITSPYWLNEKRLRDHKIALIGGKITAAARDRGRSARS